MHGQFITPSIFYVKVKPIRNELLVGFDNGWNAMHDIYIHALTTHESVFISSDNNDSDSAFLRPPWVRQLQVPPVGSGVRMDRRSYSSHSYSGLCI